jgi:MFS family permease
MSGTYRSALANREFRGLVGAQVLSEVGDQMARLGVSILVLERSGSVFFAGIAFVVGHLPAIFGSALLGPFADRMSRRTLMLFCDGVRAALIGVLAFVAVSGTPLLVLFVLLFLAELFTMPFEAARSATLPEVLTDPKDYLVGAGLSRTLLQANQVVGLAFAGLLVHLLTPRWALVIDAASFLLSFAIVLATLRERGAAMQGGAGLRGLLRDFREGAGFVFSRPATRMLIVVAWASAVFLIAPEAVALAYARQQGAEDLGGVLMAAIPAGMTVGSALIPRLAPQRQLRAIAPLVIGASLPMLLTIIEPSPVVTIVLWVLSGVCQGFVVTIIATVNLMTPDRLRGRVNGLAAAGWSAATALAFLVTGWLADLTSPADAVCIAGGFGCAVGVLALVLWPRAAMRAAGQEAYASTG